MTAHVWWGIVTIMLNFSLRKTASDDRGEYALDLTKFLGRHFYVDYTLKKFQIVTLAKVVFRKVKDLFEDGGFNLTKLTSNSEKVLKPISDKYRRKKVLDEELTF